LKASKESTRTMSRIKLYLKEFNPFCSNYSFAVEDNKKKEKPLKTLQNEEKEIKQCKHNSNDKNCDINVISLV